MSTPAFSPNENESQTQSHIATDPTEEHRSDEAEEESYADMRFVLDEPWRVKILPQQEPERLPP